MLLSWQLIQISTRKVKSREQTWLRTTSHASLDHSSLVAESWAWTWVVMRKEQCSNLGETRASQKTLMTSKAVEWECVCLLPFSCLDHRWWHTCDVCSCEGRPGTVRWQAYRASCEKALACWVRGKKKESEHFLDSLRIHTAQLTACLRFLVPLANTPSYSLDGFSITRGQTHS